MLVQTLVDAGARGVSGEELARQLGVSRVAIGKHIQALVEAGYRIDAVRGRGYRLVALPETLDVHDVERLVTDPLWVRFEGRSETGSTNEDCKALARAGAPEGTVVIAARQTAGRGRLGRSWMSPAGGVYLTVLVRPERTPADLAPLGLASALGVVMGLETIGVEAMLKWPNDVVLGTRKLGGLLLEMSAEADRVEWVVIGCGVNVHRSDEAPHEAAFVDDAARRRPAEVAAAVLDGLAQAYRAFLAEGFPALVERFERRHILPGRQVTVRDAHGELIVAGEALGVDGMGRLLVQDVEGVIPVWVGDVTLRYGGGG